MTKNLFTFLLILAFSDSLGQLVAVPEPIACPAKMEDAFTQILRSRNENQRRIPTSNIEVTYENFPDVAKVAFEAAISVWEEILISNMPIRIKAKWEDIDGSTLAYSAASRVYRNSDKVAYRDVWYVGPLAEAIAGKELNNGDFDINVTLNSNINWSYSLNGTTFQGRFDLITVVLHEIAHGLGFSSSMKLINDDSEGIWGQSGFPYIYDIFVQNGESTALTNTSSFINPSSDLQNQLVSQNLFFNVSNNKYANNLPKIFSPNPFRAGGSISHLDEDAYPPGSTNSLMSPTIRSAEANHNPGELILTMLHEMGWPVNNLESFTILAQQPEIEAKVLLYPNPSSDVIALAFPTNLRSEKTKVLLINSNGTVLSEIEKNTMNEPTFYLSTEKYPSGNYFLKINSDKSDLTKRFVKL